MGMNCDKEKIRCMHSKEAVSMLLSHAPHRLSIKEIAGITNYHRNTVRPAIKELLTEEKIHAMGDGNNTIYYIDSITSHYRRIARTIYELELNHLTDKIKLDILRGIGYNMVKDILDELDIHAEQIKNNHDSLIEALIHVKMAYPFTDLKYETSDSGTGTSVSSALEFDIPDGEFDQTDFNLNVSPCLCAGNKENFYACEMVAGALTGAIEGACGINAEVQPIGNGTSEEYGDFCTYNIKSPGFKSTTDHKVETQIRN
jgi:hypothetical protein